MVRLLHYSDIENVYDDAERAGRLAGAIAARNGADALVLGTGDNTAPGVVSMVSRGRQAIDFFEAVGTDAETFGNHDFDYGADATRELVADSPQPWLAANVRDESGDRFGHAQGVTETAVLEADGERVGLFGVTDPATDSINPMAGDLGFSDPIAAAERAVRDLRERGVDHVVALSHLGGGDDDLADLDVDVVLGGHVHSRRLEHVDGTLLTRPGVNGKAFVEVDLGADGATGAIVEPGSADDGEPAPVHGGLASALERRREAGGLTEVVTRVDEPVLRTDETTFGGESRIGNFVADAYRWAADADVGLQNGGGIREGDPLVGEVTLGDMVSVLPFEEPIVVVELTGEELLAVFAEADGHLLDFGEPEWWHAHLSNAHVTYDMNRKELVAARVGGEPVDPDRTYRVATAEYLLHSDHEFPTIDQHHRAGEYGVQHDVLADYAREFGIDSQVEGRVELRR